MVISELGQLADSQYRIWRAQSKAVRLMALASASLGA
jgi:hypothetical protein